MHQKKFYYGILSSYLRYLCRLLTGLVSSRYIANREEFYDPRSNDIITSTINPSKQR